MAICTVFIERMCDACGGTGKVQRGKQAFYTCSKCGGRGAKREAAPDLLAALKAAEKYISGVSVPGYNTSFDLMVDIRAAIRKAEGES